MFRRVASALDAGIEVRRVWASEAERGDAYHRKQLDSIRQQVAGGGNLAAALTSTDGYIPHLACEMVAVGEETGNLERVFGQLADHYEHQRALHREFIAGITYPMIQLSIAVLIVGGIIFLIGVIGKMTGETIDVLGLGLVGPSGAAIYFTIVGIMAACVLVMVRLISQGHLWMRPVQRLTARIPVIGGCLRAIALSRLTWTLELAFNTSMDTRRALKIAFESTRNDFYIQHINQVDVAIGKGESLHDSLLLPGIFPDEFMANLEVAETTGELSKSMQRMHIQYRDQAQAALKTLTMVSGFLVWGVVSLMIVAIIFRLAFWYVSMLNSLM
jgi:type II secretory pathway component PulF